MASPNSVFDEMVTTTLRHHKSRLNDNMSNHNALLSILNEKGRKELIAGGYEIVEPLDYDENGTYQRFTGFDPLNITASDVFSAAKYDWKQAAIHVVASGRELRMNAGKEQLIKLAKSRINNAFKSGRNNMSSDVYSDGTADHQITGVQAQIADSGQGTVGGIDSSQSANAFWRNVVQSVASPIQTTSPGAMSKATIQAYMLPLYLRLCRGGDKPDLITMDEEYFTFYEESLTDNKRWTGDAKKGSGGFMELDYKAARVVFDPNGGTHASGHPSVHAYFFNTDYIRLVVHKDADWSQGERQRSVNQDGVVIPILWQGNLVCGNRSLQGVLKA